MGWPCTTDASTDGLRVTVVPFDRPGHLVEMLKQGSRLERQPYTMFDMDGQWNKRGNGSVVPRTRRRSCFCSFELNITMPF